jgi:hypothetical protein
VHDAVISAEPVVTERVADALNKCRIAGGNPASILFAIEKAGAQQLISTEVSLITREPLIAGRVADALSKWGVAGHGRKAATLRGLPAIRTDTPASGRFTAAWNAAPPGPVSARLPMRRFSGGQPYPASCVAANHRHPDQLSSLDNAGYETANTG